MNLYDVLVDSAKRARVRELTRIHPWWNIKIVFLFALWAGAGALAVTTESTAVRVLGWVLAGAALQSLTIFMHEGVHGLLFENRFLNRWVGVLTGAPALVSLTAYRVIHITHHRNTGGPEDPDRLANSVPNPTLRRIFFYVWFAVGGILYVLVHVPVTSLRLAKRKERIDLAVEYGLILGLGAAVVAGLASIGRLDILLHAWLWPMLVAGFFTNLRGVTEHMMTEERDEFTSSRTVTSNRLVSFFMNNLNYHLEHHLVTRIPWYGLRKFHALLQDDCARAGSPVCRSYVRYLLEAVRLGGSGVARSDGVARSRVAEGGAAG